MFNVTIIIANPINIYSLTRKSKNSDLKIKKYKKQKPNFLGFLGFLKILKNLVFLKWVSTALMRWDIELLRALSPGIMLLLLQESNLTARQPHRAPQHVIGLQAITSEGLAQGRPICGGEVESNQRPSALNLTTDLHCE